MVHTQQAGSGPPNPRRPLSERFARRGKMSPFSCGHSVNQQRLLRMLEVLPFAPSKRRLCAGCRTRTPDDVCALLDKMTDQRAKEEAEVQGGSNTEPAGRGYWLQHALDRLAVHRRAMLKAAGPPAWRARLDHSARTGWGGPP